MKEPFRPEGTSESGVLPALLKRRLPLEAESAIYILVNAFDVWTTYLLLSQGTIFVESNPVARYFIDGWGLRGMVYFKFGLVAFVLVTCQLIAARQRVALARGVLWCATVLVSGVVIYSLTLLWRHAADPYAL